jgi:hypothetical protein
LPAGLAIATPQRVRAADQRATVLQLPKTQPKRTPAAMTRSISTRANSGFVRAARYSAGTPARSNQARLTSPVADENRLASWLPVRWTPACWLTGGAITNSDRAPDARGALGFARGCRWGSFSDGGDSWPPRWRHRAYWSRTSTESPSQRACRAELPRPSEPATAHIGCLWEAENRLEKIRERSDACAIRRTDDHVEGSGLAPSGNLGHHLLPMRSPYRRLCQRRLPRASHSALELPPA